jgi:hypothetical protein
MFWSLAIRLDPRSGAAMARNKYAEGKQRAGLPSAKPWLPVVVELPPFSQKWGQYRLTEEDRTTMLEAILSDPEGWPVQKGTAGARKARFASQDIDRGASGGYRVFYAAFRKYDKLVLITLFPKNAQANLSRAGQNLVAQLLREIEHEMEQIAREEAARSQQRRR